ncbi:SHOCT domain-containing protein [Subtercola boreus]
MSQTTAPSAVAPGPSSNDIFDQLRQLRQLGQLRDAGIITPGEFETKKAEMLARL